MGAAPGDEIQVEKASTRRPILTAQPTAGHDGVDRKIEASAIEPIGDGSLLLVADDKTPGLVVVDAETGFRKGEPLSLGDFGPIAPKWEGMAHDEPWYYVVGSHSGKLAEERKAHAKLVRFRFLSVDPPTIDTSSITSFNLAESLGEVEGLRLSGDTTEDDRVKIEGLTIRPTKDGRELVIGLRKPNDTIRVYAAMLPENSGKDSSLKLRKLFAFADAPVGEVRRELGSLEYSPEWKGFFILTLCEDEANHFDENVLWFLPDSAIPPEGLAKPTKVWTFARGFKCEGVAVLPRRIADQPDSLRLILSFDNDSAKTKMPSMIQTLTLSRKAR
jgi:hypothetical protein